ncbi:MAG: glycosyltransferase [Proteobacteria bacterium]|nr:glycosyltransferase [Pseudomonadota bacterium]
MGWQDEAGRNGASYRSTVDALLVGHGLESSWRWAGEQRDVRPFVAEASALIHPSFREGLSNVICETFALARPVLASGVGDNRWLVGERLERGLLFDPDDEGEIANAIARFSGLAAATRCAMGDAARSFAERELGFDQFIDRFEGLIALPVPRRSPGKGEE